MTTAIRPVPAAETGWSGRGKPRGRRSRFAALRKAGKRG
jgi:hypothetical protein